MKDKTVLVTGANSGIGLAASKGLAALGARVVMLCRDPARGEAARQEVMRHSGNEKVVLKVADLSSPVSIRDFVQAISEEFSALHVLYNNAGASVFERRLTPEGLEYNWMVNYLAPFMLAQGLLPLLKAGAPSRIVNITGMYHGKGKIEFDNLNGEKFFSPMQAANNAQLAKVLFTYELARRLEGTGVTANVFHPGAVRTGLQKKLPWYFQLMALPVSLFFRSPEKGAETAVWLAAAAELEGVSGQYFFDKKKTDSAPVSYDSELAKRLWESSISLLVNAAK